MKIIVAVTGASGSIYAQLLLDKLHTLSSEVSRVDVIFSSQAQKVWEYELGAPPQLYNFRSYADSDMWAACASGSAGYDAMIICPCSMGTLGRIAHGVSDTLLTRAADVLLKERKKLILVARETPYSLIHIKNMELLSLAGAIICPATPSYYSHPQTIEDVCNTVVYRILSLLGLSKTGYEWGKDSEQ